MSRQRIVILGMITKIPVAGVVWQTLHYLVGLERLGYDAYYVEAHARTPSMFMELPDDDGAGRAAAFLGGVFERFGFADRWAYHALHAQGHCYGMSRQQLDALYRSAALIMNLHGGTEPRPEHVATDRLVYLETDPVEVQIQLAAGRKETIEYLRPHCAYFTFAENYGRPDCELPVSSDFNFLPTRQPVVVDFWTDTGITPGDRYTTIGNWRQQWREVRLGGETYSWSKHLEFSKFLDVPARAGPRFDLALAGCEGQDRSQLEAHGWRVREAMALSQNVDVYRHFISRSRAEFTVAKDQNVRLKTGWFSDRSATYLAAGRPVITQDTAFGRALPTGEGLFAFSTTDDIVAAVESIEADYDRHSAAARDIAREYFEATRVVGRLLEEVGLPRVPPSLAIAPLSRRPLTLEPVTVQTVLESRPAVSLAVAAIRPAVSVVVPTCDGLVFNRLCLESVLGSAGLESLELVVVDNGSSDGTIGYLRRLAAHDGRVRVIANPDNKGFAHAVNQGVAAAAGQALVILNNDTIVPPRTIARLVVHLRDVTIGIAGAVSNRASTEAEIPVPYTTYRGLIEFGERRSEDCAGACTDIPVATLFCAALRRDLWREVGDLDERFEVAMFEDDDYSLRVRKAGLRVVCAEDAFVHHFGEATLGALVPTGRHSALFETNRARFEEKWSTRWVPHGRRPTEQYGETVRLVREMVREVVPEGSLVLVISKGDEALVALDGRSAAHFPQMEGGVYAGHHPANGTEAMWELERHRASGARYLVIPDTALWWLDHYPELRDYLDASCREVANRERAGVIFELGAS